MAFDLSKPIRVSLNGTHVTDFKEGKHDELPKLAIEHAQNLKVLKSEKGKTIENKDWPAHAKAAAEKAAAEEK